MKITIYELLGLIKDDKELPERIIYVDDCGSRYVFELENDKNYWCEELGGWLFNNWDIQLILNDEVKILDEEEEFIDIESFGIHYSWDYIDYANIEELKKYVNKDFQNIFDTLDKLIKNQKKIIQALKENK